MAVATSQKYEKKADKPVYKCPLMKTFCVEEFCPFYDEDRKVCMIRAILKTITEGL